MAYWGEAMTHTHPIWFQQDLEAGRAALERAPDAKTQRERDYIATLRMLYGEGTKEERDVRYSEGMRALAAKYRDDVDAAAFHALSILGTAHEGRDFQKYMRAAAILEEFFPKHPRHPGVLHYLIHSYDDPIHAPLGLRAARLYGSVAPNAGHALHMTTHIFVAMGMWDEVIDANRRAVDVASRDRGTAVRCGHYSNWLHYALLQNKRFDEAKEVREACRAIAIDATNDRKEVPIFPEESRPGSYAMMRLFQIIDGGGADHSFVMPNGPFVAARFSMTYGDALSAAIRKDLPALRSAAAALHRQDKEFLAAIESRKFTSPAQRQRAEIIVQQVDALVLLAEGKTDEGIALLEKAASAEQAMSFEFGPPTVEKPSLELLGDQLLALGRKSEAAHAYKSALDRTPGRTATVEGLRRATSPSLRIGTAR
jgi:tetratricopeptide (TPR) repeat protein